MPPLTQDEKLLRRATKLTRNRAGVPRELGFNTNNNLFSWTAPAEDVIFTHYRIRIDTDAGEPTYEVPAGQTSQNIMGGTRVYLSTYNFNNDLESEQAWLDVAPTDLGGGGGGGTGGEIEDDVTITAVTARFTEADSQGIRYVEVAITYDPPVGSTKPFTGVKAFMDHPDTAAGSATLGQTALGTDPINPPFSPEDLGFFAKEINPVIVRLRAPNQNEQWREYLVANGKHITQHGKPGASPNVALTITLPVDGAPQPGTGVDGQEWAPLIDKTTVTGSIEYNIINGFPVYRWKVSWTVPTDPRYGGVEIRELTADGFDVAPQRLARSTSDYISAWQALPFNPIEVTLRLISVDVNGNANSYAPGVTATLTATVQRLTGGDNTYTNNVSNLTATAAYFWNGVGAFYLRIVVSWTTLLSESFTGAAVFIEHAGDTPGGHQATGVMPPGQGRVDLVINDFPTSVQTWKINVRSESGNVLNPYQAGFTPEVSFLVGPPPPQGTQGKEYTDPAVFLDEGVVLGAANSNADGTFRSTFDFHIGPPPSADVRYSGCDVRVQQTPGGTWDLAVPAVTKVGHFAAFWETSTPNVVQNWTFLLVSYNQRGENNGYPVVGVTPMVSIQVGTTLGQLNIRQSSLASFDGTIQITGAAISTVNVNAATKTVTWVSGPLFNIQWPAGKPVSIAGVTYTVASVTNTFTFTLNETPPNLTNAQMIADGAFRARTIQLDYNGILTVINNEGGYGAVGANASFVAKSASTGVVTIIYPGSITFLLSSGGTSMASLSTINTGAGVFKSALQLNYSNSSGGSILIDPDVGLQVTNRAASCMYLSGDATIVGTLNAANINASGVIVAAALKITAGTITGRTFTGNYLPIQIASGAWNYIPLYV